MITTVLFYIYALISLMYIVGTLRMLRTLEDVLNYNGVPTERASIPRYFLSFVLSAFVPKAFLEKALVGGLNTLSNIDPEHDEDKKDVQ